MKVFKSVNALLVLVSLMFWVAAPCWALHEDHAAGDHEHASDAGHEHGSGSGHGSGTGKGDGSGGGHGSGHGEGSGHGTGSPNPLEVSPDLAVWTLVVFLVLLAILSKFAWGPIVTALDQRENRITENIAQAAQLQADAQQQLAVYEQKLAAAADEVRLLLEEARRDAEHTKDEILAQAKADAKAEQDRALREVRNAKDAALKDIGETAANFAVDMAAKIVQKQLTAEDQARLVREAVAKFPSTN